MDGRECEPGATGESVTAPQNCRETDENDERRQAGRPTTLEGDIDNALDAVDNIGDRQQPQPYPIRWLVSNYRVSAGIAAIIATELGMRRAR